MAIKLGYEVSVEKDFSHSTGARHVNIHLFMNDSNYRWEKIGEFTFQTDNQTDYEHWYGCNYTTYWENSLNNLPVNVKFMRRLGKADINWNSQPMQVVEFLLSLSDCVGRIVYDSRLDKRVKVSDIPDTNLKAYRDSHRRSCTVKVLAYDEHGAETAVAKAMVKEGYMGSLEQWILAGKPVQESWRSKPPTVETLEKLFGF